MSFDKSDLDRRMDGAVAQLQKEYSGLRTGRASTNLLEHVMVEAYGSMMPINQCGSVSVPEPRMLTVTVWDASLSKAVEKAIRDGGLGLNPIAEGTIIRVPIPQLTEERRKELTKVAAKYAEEARVAIRNIRRDGNDALKKQQKDGDITEDELKRYTDDIQKLTDSHTKRVDEMLAAKEKDVMTV
jgi:ribosome recycling factor